MFNHHLCFEHLVGSDDIAEEWMNHTEQEPPILFASKDVDDWRQGSILLGANHYRLAL